MNIPNRNEALRSPFWRAILPIFAAGLLAGEPATAAVVNTKLNGPLVDGGEISDYKISSDGQWVVYRGDQETDNARDIFGVPITGGPSVRLNGALPAGDLVDVYEITPDSQRVVYAASQESATRELFSVPIQGPAGAGIRLNPQNDQSVSSTFLITPDGSRVVFTLYVASGDWDLYSAPSDEPDSASLLLLDQVEGTTVVVLPF